MKIKEGDAFAAMKGNLFQSVIVDRNDKHRLCYWLYDDVSGEFIYNEIAKPSQMANHHLNFIQQIAKREEEQSV
jgi:hypothetical protein